MAKTNSNGVGTGVQPAIVNDQISLDKVGGEDSGSMLMQSNGHENNAGHGASYVGRDSTNNRSY
jgi:hypothetical protein